MLYGIGCDLCEIAHLEKKPYRRTRCSLYPPGVRRGRTRLPLSLDEPLPAGRSAAHRLASAAANFAAKEAFLKAAGTGLREPFSLCEIEAVRLESGAPAYHFFRPDGGMDAGPWPCRPALSEPRGRHGAGLLHTGNSVSLCAYNGISPALHNRRTAGSY